MKANRLIIMVLIIGSSFLMSCMLPRVYNYYSPEAEGGTAKRSLYLGHPGPGPHDKIEFSHDGVTISIGADELQDGIKVVINIVIPKGNKVLISTSLVNVFIPSNENVFEGILNPPWQINNLLVGETTELGRIRGTKRTRDKLFRMNGIINFPKSEMIKLILPTIYINNKQLQLPGITFTKDKVFGVTPCI